MVNFKHELDEYMWSKPSELDTEFEFDEYDYVPPDSSFPGSDIY